MPLLRKSSASFGELIRALKDSDALYGTALNSKPQLYGQKLSGMVISESAG